MPPPVEVDPPVEADPVATARAPCPRVELRTAATAVAEFLTDLESGDLEAARARASGAALADLEALTDERFGVPECVGEHGEHRCTGFTESGWYCTAALAQVEWDVWTVRSIEFSTD